MKAIINGKRYDTETAELVAGLTCTFNCGDFDWHDTGVYRTSRGAWFLAGSGGARSMWARSIGQNGSGGGSGIQPLSEAEAREYLERENAIEALETYFAAAIEDA